MERRKLEEAVAKELKGKAAAAQPEPAAAASSSGAASAGGEGGENDAAEDGVDALDAFMSNVETQIEQDKVSHSSLCVSTLCFRTGRWFICEPS